MVSIARSSLFSLLWISYSSFPFKHIDALFIIIIRQLLFEHTKTTAFCTVCVDIPFLLHTWCCHAGLLCPLYFLLSLLPSSSSAVFSLSSPLTHLLNLFLPLSCHIFPSILFFLCPYHLSSVETIKGKFKMERVKMASRKIQEPNERKVKLGKEWLTSSSY